MNVHTLLPRGRGGAACLVTLALLGSVGFASTAAAAMTKQQIARHERYLACKAKLQQDPPCQQVWTRHCARMCNAIFW
jgi:hypothetical protein